jgi:hypothetical protein
MRTPWALRSKSRIQVGLQPRHLVAHGRGRQMQLGGGQRKTLAPGHRFEGLEVGGWENGHGGGWG